MNIEETKFEDLENINAFMDKSEKPEMPDYHGIKTYLNAGGELLKPEEEKELSKRSLAGDLEARNTLVEKNLRLVMSIASRYKNIIGVEYDDLVQMGMIGLIKAAELYDGSLGNRFSTYATWWIRQSIMRSLANEQSLIRVPVHAREDISRMRKAENDFMAENERFPTLKEISEITGLSERTVMLYRRSWRIPASLDKPAQDENGNSPLIEFMQGSYADPEKELRTSSIKDEAYRAMAKANFSERDRAVIIKRFGLDGNHGMTLEELGREFGITRERIRQIEQKGIRRLKKYFVQDGFTLEDAL